MGIYIQTVAARPDSLGDDPAGKLAQAVRVWARKRGIEDLLYLDPHEDRLRMSLHPVTGVEDFEISEQHVSFGAKTSIAGPGFHIALVELCDHLQREFGLQWRWDADGDTTGYAIKRSTSDLCGEFLEQLRAQCRAWEKFKLEEGYSGMAMNLEIGLSSDEPGQISFPTGTLPFQTLIAFGSANDDELLPFAQEFYPWWNKDADKAFWTNTLRALLWCNAPWHRPEGAWETHCCRAIDAAAKHAKGGLLGRLPPDLDEAYQELCARIADDRAPAPSGIGYLRQTRQFEFTGNWRIRAPGYYHEQREDEGRTILLWHGTEEMRGTSFALRREGGPGEAWVGGLKDEPEHQSGTCVYRVASQAAPIENSAARQTWIEAVAVEDDGTIHLLMASVTSDLDAAALMERARKLAKGVVFDKPQRAAPRADLS